MRLVVVTPKVDPGDDLFGHVHGWMSALASRVERLHVIALWDGQPSLPANTTFESLGKGKVESRAIWLWRLQRALTQQRFDAVLAHMGPVFAVAAAPLVLSRRAGLFLWYAHGAVSPMLRIAHVLCRAVGTSTPEGFRIPSSKVHITGQGIDPARFATSSTAAERRILSVGRYSPIKDYETLLDGYAMLGSGRPPLEVIGGAHSESEERYVELLRGRARTLGLAFDVNFRLGVPHSTMPTEYARASVFATCSRTGSLDKVVLEAACSGVVPIVCNGAFRELMGADWARLSFEAGDARGLSARLKDWISATDAERRDVAGRLRDTIVRSHSVEHWADAVIAMISSNIGAR